ncbi:MAG: class I SAM-dependent methyltransferase [Terriglobia bacterium]
MANRRALLAKEFSGAGSLDRKLLDRIIAVSQTLHTLGSFSPRALEIIARHLSSRPIQHSMETGCGVSTLILSNLSPDHTVFALDRGGSIANTKSSELFDPATTTFVEGPTQKTLPSYEFRNKLQVALLDGPHAFPFPQLEYYYVYPHLEEGALLIIDNMWMPSIHDLFEVLKADDMFRLVDVVNWTAFFRRTSAPVFDPWGDGFWLQKYNRRIVVHEMLKERINRPPSDILRAIVHYAKLKLGHST